MRRRQVAVVGNCQAAFTAKLYREFFGGPAHEDVRHVDDYALDHEAVWREVGEADLVLLQQRDFNSPQAEAAPAGAQVVTYPLVLEAFLWPYAHEAHVHNKPEPPLGDGPYPAQLGDKFLNRMITQGVAPEAALEQYLAHDIVGATHIDRLYELHMEQQRDRDERTGFDIASVIERDFRDKALFMSPHHPHAWMFGVFLAQLFAKMGLDADVIQAMRDSLHSSPFPSGELPIHPGVVRHFGLKFAGNDRRYMFHDEGDFSFDEHVLRYMRYEHNHALRTGMHHFHNGRDEAGLALIEEGLKTSPNSNHAWRAKGLLLARFDRRPESADAFRRAVDILPQDPEAYAELARTLMELDRTEEALQVIRRAVALAPHHGHSQLVMAELLLRTEDFPAAVRAAREAARLMPAQWFCCWITALAYWRNGEADDAQAFCERALRLEPKAADPRNLLAEILELAGRRDAALEVLEEGGRVDGYNDQTYSLLGHFHLRKARVSEGELKRSELQAALKAFERGTELKPGREDFGGNIAEMHERLAALA